jgi:hypothetical protein
MSTEAKTEPTGKTWERAECHIPTLISISLAPCRMISVEIFGDEDGGHWVKWTDVVGVLCIMETEYVKRYHAAESWPQPGATHQEMTDLGWRSNHPPNWFPVVWPVVAGANGGDEYGLRVLHERFGGDAVFSTVVACTWEPSEDRTHAIRLAQEMLRTRGSGMGCSMGNCADLPPQSDVEKTADEDEKAAT